MYSHVPNGQKSRADVIINAIRIAQVATGETHEAVMDDGKHLATKALGAKGGRKPTGNMTPRRLAELAGIALPSGGSVKSSRHKIYSIGAYFLPCVLAERPLKIIVTGLLNADRNRTESQNRSS